jgi:hypothetical protein
MKINPIASNMTEVETEKATILFSYKTPVACCMNDGSGFYVTTKKWSRTTSKHINKWIGKAQVFEREQSFFDSLV